MIIQHTREDSNLFYLLSFQVLISVSFVIFFAYFERVTQNNLILISSLSYNNTGIIFIFIIYNLYLNYFISGPVIIQNIIHRILDM